MSREKQIEEMAEVTIKHCEIDNQCGSCHWSTCNKCLSEVLYNAGYRKQEWISVEERLPETTCECLAVGKSGCIFLLCYSSRYMAFNATDGDGEDRWKVNDITHWMPLPEPPKGE